MSATESPTTAPGTGRRAAALAMLVAAAIPLVVLVGSGAGHVLDPRERAWLMRGDAAQHLVAWSFYAREPWRWPPASIERWPAPLGTTIGLADAIPLVAMPLKAIAGERAADLQYFGLWSALCLAALGATSALFLLEARGGALLAALGGGLVALSPVVWDRLTRGHPSLAAHALLVGLFVAWLRYFRSGGGRRPLIAATALVVLAAAVHPYLLVMVAMLFVAMVACGARRFGARTLWRSGAAVALVVGAAPAVLWFSGFLGVSPRDLAAGGFGGFEADLLAPLNSARFSRWIPALFEGDPNREGFAYLGLGAIALGAIALGAVALGAVGMAWSAIGGSSGHPPRGDDPARAAPVPGMRPLVVATLALAALAVVPRIQVGGRTLVDLTRILSPVEPFFDFVRANGRLVWPLYLLTALGIPLAWRRWAPRRAVPVGAVLGLALALQIVEAPRWSWGREGIEVEPSGAMVRLDRLAAEARGVHRLALVPAYLLSGGGFHCGRDRHADGWVEPALIAARRGWSYNSGYLARADEEAAAAACAASELEAIRAAPSADTLYLVSTRQSRRLEQRGAGFRCERLSRNDRLCRFEPRLRRGTRGGRREQRAPDGQGSTKLHQEVVPDSKPSE